jgi:3D (Asp-Asp-Asp) domain-containing protein
MRGADAGVQPTLSIVVPTTLPEFRLASTAAYERARSETEILAEIEQRLRFEVPAESKMIHRVCRVTAYCDRGITASGIPSGVGQCAAPGDIPLGSTVYIPDLGRTFVVTDRTHRRFRRSTVDIFIPSKRECRTFGRSFLECEFTVPVD